MDIARALATIAVVVIHISAPPLGSLTGSGWVGAFYIALNTWARFAVPTFVVLSGAGLSLSERSSEGYFRFLWSRLSKIVPIYLTWTVIYTILDSGHGYLGLSHSFTIERLIANALTGRACYHLYFVPLIVMQYMLFPVLRNIMKTNTGIIACFAITFAALYVNSYIGYPHGLRFLAFAGNPLNWLFYMAFGVWLAKPEVIESLTSSAKRHASAISYALFAIIMIGLSIWITKSGKSIDSALALTGLLMMPYTILFFIWVYKQEWSDRSMAVLKWISRNSFAIYLSHPLILTMFWYLAYGNHIKNYGPDYGLTGFAAALAGASLLALIGTKTKGIIIAKPRKGENQKRD